MASRNRKIWMMPRNIRQIRPWKLMQILELFEQAQLSEDWNLNLKTLLEEKSLKRDFGAYDKNPGGDRTYISQLNCLGLLYKENNKLVLTKAGLDLKNGNEPLKVLQSQLLNLQYPSTYSIGRNVAIDGSVVVKPVVFVLELIKHFEYLRREELAVAVVYGHDHQASYKKCIEKIKQIREEGCSLIDVIDSPADLVTAKTAIKPIAQRVGDILDIANTLENWMESAQLTIRVKQEGILTNFINLNYSDLIEGAFLRKNTFIETKISEIKKSSKSFDIRFGSWDGKKDTRNKVTQSAQSSPEELLLRNEIIELMSNKILTENDCKAFKDKMSKLGIDKSLIDTSWSKYSAQNLSVFEDQYLRLSTSGKHQDGIKFEVATVELLRKLNLDVKHVGQLKRPKGKFGSYADILVSLQDEAILIDTKASPKYAIPHPDAVKAISTYIPYWDELRTEHDITSASSLLSFSYIAGGFLSEKSLPNKTRQIAEETNSICHINAMTAGNLLLFVKSNPTKEAFFDTFRKDGVIDLREATC